jgi:hypothetical protein
MKTQRRFPVLVPGLCCLFLFPWLLLSQAAPGRLRVTSEPPGATVTIDNRQMSKQTDSTFVVFPGNHTVSVKGKDQAGKIMYCAASLYVGAGATKSVHCTARGWDPPLK